jgi:hypothetical protein
LLLVVNIHGLVMTNLEKFKAQIFEILNIALGSPLRIGLLYQKSYLIIEHIQLSLLQKRNQTFFLFSIFFRSYIFWQ